MPELGNLWIASAATHEQRNLVGSLLQAEMILASLGFKVSETSVAEFEAQEEVEHEASL
ncbi:hypothetical protein D3C87_2180240 [compost metagenome]